MIRFSLYLLLVAFFLFSGSVDSFPFRAKRAFSYIANETACTVDHVVYKDGDPIPTDDPCETCRCRPPGFNCVLRHCEVKTGCRAIRRLGECCPSYQCGCEHNGQFYQDGERIHNAESPCYSCYCQGSSITCSLADCKFRFDCEPEYVAGECCPRYDHCPPEIGLTVNASSTTTSAAPTTTTQKSLTVTTTTTSAPPPLPPVSSTIDEPMIFDSLHRPLFNIDFSKINDTTTIKGTLPDSNTTTPTPYFMSSALINSTTSGVLLGEKITPETSTTAIPETNTASTALPEINPSLAVHNRTMIHQSQFKKLDIEPEPDIPVTTTTVPDIFAREEMATTTEIPINQADQISVLSSDTEPEVAAANTEAPTESAEALIIRENTTPPPLPESMVASITTTEVVPKINQSELISTAILLNINSGDEIDAGQQDPEITVTTTEMPLFQKTIITTTTQQPVANLTNN